MRNRAGALGISNIEQISFTRERDLLTSSILEVFTSLDPQKILKNIIGEIFSEGMKYRNIYVIGFGKASLAMYSGVRESTSEIAEYSGVIIPEGSEYNGSFDELEVLRGTHPFVSELSVQSTGALLEHIGGHGEEDLIIVLISGGGSALFEMPVNGLTVEKLGEVSKCVMESGASIRELNIIRHSISRIKGGKLAKILYPSQVESFIVSDVPGDDLQLIASGPLIKPNYTRREFEGILENYSKSCPQLRDMPFEIPDFSDGKVFSKIHSRIVLRNSDFVRAFARYFSGKGENVRSVSDPVTGDVEDVSEKLVKSAREYYSEHGKPVWLVAGGETTVSVKGNGIGGRNCELSMRVAESMQDGEDFTFASIGTDGIDGVSPSMGGITDSWFREHADQEEVNSHLERSDSYTLLEKMNSAILTGYTGTNVSDIFILYYNGPKEKE